MRVKTMGLSLIAAACMTNPRCGSAAIRHLHDEVVVLSHAKAFRYPADDLCVKVSQAPGIVDRDIDPAYPARLCLFGHWIPS